MAISNDGELLYHPNGAHILVSEAHTGRKVGLLRGHYNLINSIAYHPVLQVSGTNANVADKGEKREG